MAIPTTVFIHDNVIGNTPARGYILPVTPERLNIVLPGGITRNVVTRIGEISQVGHSRLQGVNFQSFFPTHADSYTVHSNTEFLISPEEWVTRIKGMKSRPIRLVISGLRVDMICLLNNFSYWQVGGDGRDIRYSMSFIEHKPVAVRSITLGTEGLAVANSLPNNSFQNIPSGSTYEVKLDDTWSTISQKTGVLAVTLMEINDITNPFLLRPRQKIVVVPTIKVLVGSADDNRFGFE